jgi:hypothetical protein
MTSGDGPVAASFSSNSAFQLRHSRSPIPYGCWLYVQAGKTRADPDPCCQIMRSGRPRSRPNCRAGEARLEAHPPSPDFAFQQAGAPAAPPRQHLAGTALAPRTARHSPRPLAPRSFPARPPALAAPPPLAPRLRRQFFSSSIDAVRSQHGSVLARARAQGSRCGQAVSKPAPRRISPATRTVCGTYQQQVSGRAGRGPPAAWTAWAARPHAQGSLRKAAASAPRMATPGSAPRKQCLGFAL